MPNPSVCGSGFSELGYCIQKRGGENAQFSYIINVARVYIFFRSPAGVESKVNIRQNKQFF